VVVHGRDLVCWNFNLNMPKRKIPMQDHLAQRAKFSMAEKYFLGRTWHDY
jgi:hypothetical protein